MPTCLQEDRRWESNNSIGIWTKRPGSDRLSQPRVTLYSPQFDSAVRLVNRSTSMHRAVLIVFFTTDLSVVLKAIQMPVVCRLATKMFCPCAHEYQLGGKFSSVVREFRRELSTMVCNTVIFLFTCTYITCYIQVNSGRYERFRDFTVVLQTGLNNLELPRLPESKKYI